MAKDRDGDRDIVAEIINMVAAQVSSGVRVAGEVRERQEQARQQLEGGLRALRDAADVSVRMIRLLDEIEQPLRESIPVIRRAAGVLDEVLDALPDDLASQLSEALPRVRSLLDALAPLAAMGAAMAPRSAAAPMTSPSRRPAAPAKKAARTTASAAKKTAGKKAAPKKAPQTTSGKKAAPKKTAGKKTAAKTSTPRKAAAKNASRTARPKR